MPYVFAPLSDVKGLHDYKEYQDAMQALEDQARARARTIWTGASDGGILPQQNQYGVGPLRKNDMAGDTTDSVPSGTYTFRKNITATGWLDIFNYTVRNVEIHAFAGWLITDDVLRIIQMRVELGNTRFPIFDLQEAQRYDRFAIIMKTDRGAEMVVDPGSRVLVRIYAETVGNQRVVPLGLNLFRRTDIMLNET